MGINTFPETTSGQVVFGASVPDKKYGNVSSTAKSIEFTITGSVPAGVYVGTYKAQSNGGLIFGTEELDFGTTAPQLINISTSQTTYTYRTIGYWNEDASLVALTTKASGMVYANGYYVISGGNIADGCVSTNGLNWATLVGAYSQYGSQRELSFANGFFFVNGPGTTANNTNIMISTNAVNWASRLVATSVTPKGPWQYATAQGLYWNNYLNGAIVVSSNLTTFTTRAVFAGTGDGQDKVAFYINPWWVMVGSGGVIVSTNGTTWTTRDVLPGSGFSPLTAAYGNNRLVVSFSSTQTTAVSTDMINWTTGSFGWSSAVNMQYMTYGNGYFVAVAPGLNSRTGIFSSTNGLNWVERYQSTNNSQKAIVWGSSGGYLVHMDWTNGGNNALRSLTVGGRQSGNQNMILEGARTDTVTYPTV